MGMTDHSITHTHTINTKQDKQPGSGCERSRLSLVCQRRLPGPGAVPTVSYQHSHLEMKQTTGNKTTLRLSGTHHHFKLRTLKFSHEVSEHRPTEVSSGDAGRPL